MERTIWARDSERRQVADKPTMRDAYTDCNADSYGNIHTDPAQPQPQLHDVHGHADCHTNGNLYTLLHVHLLHWRHDRSRNYRHRQPR